MTLQQLRYLIQVVASGSISSAATKLLIAQPSLSKAMSELEREMGVTILTRTSRGVTLTEEGERFCAYARQVVDQADRLEERYKDAGGAHRSLGVTVPHDATIVEALAEVAQTQADGRLAFRLREGGAEAAIEDVRTQRSEVGVALRPACSRKDFDAAVHDVGLRYAPIITLRPRVLVGATSPLARRDHVEADELLGMPCVLHATGDMATDASLSALLGARLPARRVHVDDWGSLRQLVISLGGFALAAPIVPSRLLDAGLAAPVLEGGELVDVGFLTRPGYSLSAPASDFVARLSEFSRLHR